MSAFPSKAAGERLLAILKAAGIARVRVEYSGSGDSGSINDVSCFDSSDNELPIEHIAILWPNTHGGQEFDAQTGRWLTKRHEDTETPLNSALEDVCNSALEVTGLDWYNNDGGQGHLEITFGPDGEPQIELEVGINVTTTEDHAFCVLPDGDVVKGVADEENDDAP